MIEEKIGNTYDYNLWSDEYNSLFLTAYELKIADGNTQTNTSKYTSLKLTLPADRDAISYLLGDLYLNHYPFAGHDDWIGIEDLDRATMPIKVQDFLDKLPEYEPAIEGETK